MGAMANVETGEKRLSVAPGPRPTVATVVSRDRADKQGAVPPPGWHGPFPYMVSTTAYVSAGLSGPAAGSPGPLT